MTKKQKQIKTELTKAGYHTIRFLVNGDFTGKKAGEKMTLWLGNVSCDEWWSLTK